MSEIATFDHYEVLTRDDGSLYELGRGAMGVTYKAFDTSLRFPVCLKVINSTYLNSEVARQRFIREARSAAKLRHRNVASVFHLATEGDTWFYAMEFIDGETLEAVIKREGTLAPRAALEITAQVCRALNAATQHGLVHRDIKPANLMLVKEDDEIVAKVIDFGLAKSALGVEGEDAATLSLGGFVGTPHFASPEQLEEREIDVRSDMYSLGVTLWYMLAGQPPFAGSMAQVMSQHLSKPPPFEKFKTLPPDVAALLKKMLEKAPEDRFQTPTELRRAIEEVMGSLSHAPAEAKTTAPVEDEEFATLLDVAAKRPGETRFEAGVTIAGRYRIVEAMGETNAGRVFRAEDSAQNRTVRLLVLRQEVLNDSAVCTALEREVERLAQTQHPNLLGVFNFETIENASFLAMEWTDGFSLLDLLRARRELGADEAMALLKQAAGGLDYALKHGLTGLEFGLHQVMLHFDAPFERDKLLHAPMGKWPAFTLKLYPLGLARDLNSGRTWAGGQTMVEGAVHGGDEADAKGRYIRALATVIYELLGGTISPLMLGGAGMAESRYTPLSTLTEEGNEVLKRALDPAYSFEGAQAFCDALGRPDGMHSARREQATPVVRRDAPPPVIRRESAPPAEKSKFESKVPQQPPVVPGPKVSPLAGSIAARTRRPKKSKAPALVLGAAVAMLAVGGGGYYLFHEPAKDVVASDKKDTNTNQGSGEPADPGKSGTDTPPKTDPAITDEPKKTPQNDGNTSETLRQPVIVEAPKVSDADLARQKTEKLEVALKAAENLEKRGDTQAALQAYVKIVKDFPDGGAETGRKHLESLLDRLLQKQPALTLDEFEPMRESAVEAAQQGVLSAQVLLGVQLIRQSPAEGFRWLQKAADAGSPAAMKELGLIYASGISNLVDRNPQKAVEYFQQAADKNYMPAKSLLAECYMDEKEAKGVPKDEERGLKLLREAAAAKDLHGMANLGAYLARPEDPRPISARKEDFEEAFRLLSEAQEGGSTDALASLGAMYMNGVVPGSRGPDFKKGAEFFKDGAKKGNKGCMFQYARCLEKGLGVKANQLEAENWALRAAKEKYAPAIDWCRAHHVNLPAPEPASLTGTTHP
jgi:serine/threonine protein kinase/TPR repeat protein